MTTAAITTSERKTPRRAWAVLAVTYFASVVAPLVQMKIPGLASWLFPAFMLDATTFGLLMSALSIIGVIMAFPVAFLIRRFGLKAMMVVSLAALGIGSAMGALSATGSGPGNTTMLLASRMIEGVGLGCIGVVGPSCLSVWFPDKTRGFALGVWATWVPMGATLALNLAPAITISCGENWRVVFWICAALCALALVLFCIVFKMPEESESDTSKFDGSVSDAVAVLKNKYIWILGIVFFIFNGVLVGISSGYQNTFIETQLGFTAQEAGSLAGIGMIVTLVCAPIMGALIDRAPIDKKKYLAAGSMALLLASMYFKFAIGPNGIAFMWVDIILGGALGGLCAGSCRPLAPIVMQRSAIGATMGMAVLQFMQNLGQSIYSPLFGALVDSTGDWQMSLWILALPTLAVAFVLCFFITTKKSLKAQASESDGK